MANRKITDLPVVGAIQDDDTFHITQSAIDKRGTFTYVKQQILLDTQTLVDEAEAARDASQASETNAAASEAAAAASAAFARDSVSGTVFVAHGKIGEPIAQDDFDCPVTVANQCTVKAATYRINESIVQMPDTVITFPAAPATSALLSRTDLVYLRENGTFGVYEGTNDNPTMTDAGFSPVVGEVGLWFDGTDYAIPIGGQERYNQGAYHPYFNEWGVRNTKTTSSQNSWYAAGAINPLSSSDCFLGGQSYPSSGGNISSGLSGRHDSRFHDGIYLDRFQDYRLQANAPTVYQTNEYWAAKAKAGTLKHFVTEGIPVTKPFERGVVETQANLTAVNNLFEVSNSSNYTIGDFVIILNQDNVAVTSGYVRSLGTSPDRIGLTETFAFAKDNNIGSITKTRTNGDVYTILKVEYTTATGADNTWTNIIGDPANYPRQATGVVDHLSGDGTVSLNTGDAVRITTLTTGAGTIGNVYVRLGASSGSINLETQFYTTTSQWLDLGPLATYQANATGIEGFPLLYGENGEDLIPDGTSKNFKMSRKVVEAFGRVESTDKGVSWASSTGWDAALESSANAQTATRAAGEILLVSYTTPTHIFTEDVNGEVLAGEVSSVWASNYHVEAALASDLIEKVLTANVNPRGLHKNIEGYAFDSLGKLQTNSFNSPSHSVIALTDNANSPAAKAFFHLSAANPGDQIKLHAKFKEMVYDDGKDSVTDFTSLDGTTAQTYTAGNYYVITGLDVEYVVYCETTGSYVFSTLTPSGDSWLANSGAVLFRNWDGNGWGDNNKFTIVDNVSTEIDDNTNTILVGSKSTVTPIVYGG